MQRTTNDQDKPVCTDEGSPYRTRSVLEQLEHNANEYPLQVSDRFEISDGCQVVIGVGEDDMAGRKSCQEK